VAGVLPRRRGPLKLLADNELRGDAKREIQYRNLVETWASARGLELDARTMTSYAAATFQDPKVVKETCRKAEESRGHRTVRRGRREGAQGELDGQEGEG